MTTEITRTPIIYKYMLLIFISSNSLVKLLSSFNLNLLTYKVTKA